MKTTRILLFTAFAAGLALMAMHGRGTALAASTPTADIESGMRVVSDAYALIQKNYADPVETDRAFYQGAIPGMLMTLDPHSSFLTPAEYAEMQRKQHAQYSGVGMVITVDQGNTVAFEPFPGSPAMQAGLRRGDILISVDGNDTRGMKSDKVADMLRGQRGTEVKITVKRPSAPDPLTFTVTRGDISTSQVDAYWVKPGMAYLGVNSFESQAVAKDVEAGLARLGERNVTGLVLDLRGNRGGLVTEAVALAGRFLRDGQVVVSDHGRAAREQVYRAKAQPLAQNYPLVVLVDRDSASASEIVSGALQDHDRAWIVGEPTFGKGLVQAQFPLAEGAALLLTIAHYYTPSGRLIQRDYTKQSFFSYYFSRKEDTPSQADVKATDSGRKVYGGGGITPDEKYTPPRSNSFLNRIASVDVNAVFHFGSIYFGNAVPQLPSPTWSPDADTLDRFKNFLRSQNVSFTEEEFAQNRKWISDSLRLELLMRAYDRKTAERAIMTDDPEVHMALDSMPKAQSLLDRRGVVTQRAATAAPKR
jgi:carboxyl-terminal processing protease